jgi:uncharacterized membrane protein
LPLVATPLFSGRKPSEDLFLQSNPGLPPAYTLSGTGERGETAVDGDFFTFENVVNHVHGAINHFPIALLFASVGFDLFAGKRPNLRFSAWLLLALGTIGAVAATVSGLVAHLAYEDDPVLASAIEVHQYTAFAATAVFAALAAWRWFSLRRGSDVGGSRAYLVLALLGLSVLGVTGFLGGNLLTEWGIGVQGVTR